MSPAANSLVGDEITVAQPTFRTSVDGSGAASVRSLDIGSDAVPRIVAAFLLVALGTIIIVHVAGLRAMVTVGN